MKNNPQISLREAINSMTEIISPDYIPDCKIININNIITHCYEDIKNYESDNYYLDGNYIWY